MHNRALTLARVCVLLLFGGVTLWAELSYEGLSGGTADPGTPVTGTVIEPDAHATGSDRDAAITGAEATGTGAAGQVEAVIQGPAKPATTSTARTAQPTPATRLTPPRVSLAAAKPLDDARPRIAIVMGQTGIGNARSRHAIERLQLQITFAIVAYSDIAAARIRDPRPNGHETLLAIPMEPTDYPRHDPGPKPLLIDLDDLEKLSRLEKALSGLSGYVGLLSHMRSRFLANPDRLRPILAATADKGLIFLDSRPGPDSAVSALAPTVGLHVALNDRFIDDVPSRDAIAKRHGELEAIAERRGFAFVLTPLTGVARRLDP